MYFVKKNEGINLEIIDLLIDKYFYGRFLEDERFSLNSSKLLMRDNFIDFLKKDFHNYFLVFDNSNNPCGLMFFKESIWDKEHFGYNVSVIDYVITVQNDYEKSKQITSILLKHFDDWCLDKKIKFVTFKIPSKDLAVIHEVENNKFLYIENWIYNSFDLRKYKSDNISKLRLRYADKSDENYMIEFSKGSFNSHRFHADKMIDINKADSLYEKWIRNAFDDPNQKIVVYDHGKTPSAFMIYRIVDFENYFNCKFAMWNMGLVNPDLKRMGIGYDFIRALFLLHKKEGIDMIDSGLSIRNIPSLNWHNKLNFKITSTLVTFHKWYK